MPFKPNYNAQRMERARAKEAKKEQKLQLRKEQALLRKTQTDNPPANEGEPSDEAGE
jgi:hypothetical protein